MDSAHNQHSSHSKRNNRSNINLNHLSLAPLTSKLPLNDAEALPEPDLYVRSPQEHYTSYIEGRSAPTTPGILSRSSSRVSLRKTNRDGLPKSKSSTFIANKNAYHPKSVATTPSGKRRGQGRDDSGLSMASPMDRSDSDWLLRAGAMISSETRESKGQAWLVSRASSTSLTGARDEDEEELDQELARERGSRHTSRKASATGGYGDADDEYSPITRRMSFGGGSRPISRHGSRANSRQASRVRSMRPMTGVGQDHEGYFDGEQPMAEPDFVDVEEELYEANKAAEDDVAVRRLAKNGTLGLGVWVEKVMGWNLFSVEEDEEGTDTETTEPMTDASEGSSRSRIREENSLHISANAPDDARLPPPGLNEGGWQDAAWLFSVATKVLL